MKCRGQLAGDDGKLPSLTPHSLVLDPLSPQTKADLACFNDTFFLSLYRKVSKTYMACWLLEPGFEQFRQSIISVFVYVQKPGEPHLIVGSVGGKVPLSLPPNSMSHRSIILFYTEISWLVCRKAAAPLLPQMRLIFILGFKSFLHIFNQRPPSFQDRYWVLGLKYLPSFEILLTFASEKRELFLSD